MKFEEFMEIETKEDEMLYVEVHHDECCFSSNDRGTRTWYRDDSRPLMPKSRGRTIHVSDFIVEEHGSLCFEGEKARSVFIVEDGHFWENNQFRIRCRSFVNKGFNGGKVGFLVTVFMFHLHGCDFEFGKIHGLPFS